MQELTFGRLRRYPKAITPEVEAAREAERIELRKTMTPAYVTIYDKVVAKESDDDLKAIARSTFELIHELYPDIVEIVAKNWITMSNWELAIRQRNS